MKTFLAAVLLLIAVSAKAAPQDLTLKFQESLPLTPDGPWVKFAGYSDTRCPADVACGVAGIARVLLIVEGGRRPEVALLEGGLGDPDRFDAAEIARLTRAAPVHRGYRFLLLSLEPPPRVARRGDPSELVARIRIEPVRGGKR